MKKELVYDGTGAFTAAGKMETFGYMPGNEVLQIVDRFNPADQWTVAQKIVGNAIVLTDTFLPPSQLGKAPKMNANKVPSCYTPIQIEARTPSSSLFGIGRSYLRGMKFLGLAQYGATGPFTVSEFNRTGYTGTVWEDSPTVAITDEWLKRMGVKDEDWGHARISMQNGYDISIGVKYDSGIGGTPYDGRYTPGDVADMGYAMIMLTHYFSKYGGADGSFVTKLNIGEKKSRFLVVEKNGKSIKCNIRAKDNKDVAEQILSEEGLSDQAHKLDADGFSPLRGQTMIDALAYAVGDAVDMYDYTQIHLNKEKGLMLAEKHVAFEINIPDAQDSIEQ